MVGRGGQMIQGGLFGQNQVLAVNNAKVIDMKEDDGSFYFSGGG